MYFSYVCYTSEATPITMVRSVLEATTLDDDSFRVRIHLDTVLHQNLFIFFVQNMLRAFMVI